MPFIILCAYYSLEKAQTKSPSSLVSTALRSPTWGQNLHIPGFLPGHLMHFPANPVQLMSLKCVLLPYHSLAHAQALGSRFLKLIFGEPPSVRQGMSTRGRKHLQLQMNLSESCEAHSLDVHLQNSSRTRAVEVAPLHNRILPVRMRGKDQSKTPLSLF